MRIIFDLWCFVLLIVGTVGLAALLAWLSYRYSRRQNRTWQSALSELPIGIMLFDRARQRRFANPAADALAAQLDPGAFDRLCQTAAPNLRQSTVLRGSDGQTVQTQAIALPDAGYTLVTLWDLSQRQQAEASYRKLIRTLSHELLTPLTAMQGHLAHIASSISEFEQNDANWLGSLEVSREEVERLTRAGRGTSSIPKASMACSARPTAACHKSSNRMGCIRASSVSACIAGISPTRSASSMTCA